MEMEGGGGRKRAPFFYLQRPSTRRFSSRPTIPDPFCLFPASLSKSVVVTKTTPPLLLSPFYLPSRLAWWLSSFWPDQMADQMACHVDWIVVRQVCLSRDTHEWGADRLKDIRDKWEPTPEHMILMDVKVCLYFCFPLYLWFIASNTCISSCM